MRCSQPAHACPGTAVFLNADAGTTPNALLHNLKHNKVLHEQNLFVTVKSHEVPWIKPENRIELEDLGRTAGRSCCTPASRRPHVPEALKLPQSPWGGIWTTWRPAISCRATSSFPPLAAAWRPGVKNCFAGMHRNAAGAADFLSLPANRVVELGSKVEI